MPPASSPPTHPALRLWLGWARALRRWHRYEVTGIEHLDGPPKMIVGYHGRYVATDLIILNQALWERHGRIPISILHSYFDRQPALKWLKDGLGFVVDDGPELAAAVAAGRHVILLPGGNREANRSFRVRYRVDWGKRLGWLKLALRLGLPVVPVAASGVDDTYIGLNDGYAWGRRLQMPYNLPAWLALGPLGPVPFSPPFPVKVRQWVGEPIDLLADGPVDVEDRAALERLSARVTGALQDLLDRARAAARA